MADLTMVNKETESEGEKCEDEEPALNVEASDSEACPSTIASQRSAAPSAPKSIKVDKGTLRALLDDHKRLRRADLPKSRSATSQKTTTVKQEVQRIELDGCTTDFVMQVMQQYCSVLPN